MEPLELLELIANTLSDLDWTGTQHCNTDAGICLVGTDLTKERVFIATTKDGVRREYMLASAAFVEVPARAGY